jgi:hypothetical protein
MNNVIALSKPQDDILNLLRSIEEDGFRYVDLQQRYAARAVPEHRMVAYVFDRLDAAQELPVEHRFYG